MPARKLGSATPYDSFTLWTEGFSFRFWTEGLRGTEFGSYYWLLLSKTLLNGLWEFLRCLHLQPMISWAQKCQTPDQVSHGGEQRSWQEPRVAKSPKVFQRRVMHGIGMTIWPACFFIFVLWSNKQNLVMFEWDESVVVLPAPDDWPHWKLSRLIITPMAEPGSQPYVYSAVLWLQTQHSGWTRRRALATFYPGWDLGGNNNLGNRLSEVTDQHNAPKRTFVRLWLWCLFKENNHQCLLLIRK